MERNGGKVARREVNEPKGVSVCPSGRCFSTPPPIHPPLLLCATMSALDEIDLPTHVGEDAAAAAGPSASAKAGGPGASGGDDIEADDDDAELEAMKARVAEMEAEAAKLREMQEQAEREAGGGRAGGGANTPVSAPTDEEKEEVDARSVYVGNVRAESREPKRCED